MQEIAQILGEMVQRGGQVLRLNFDVVQDAQRIFGINVSRVQSSFNSVHVHGELGVWNIRTRIVSG